MTAYTWTTGPVNSSEGASCVQVVLTNNSNSSRKAVLKLFDLAFTPRKLIVNETISLKPYGSAFVTIPLRRVCHWELRYTAYTKQVRASVNEKGRSKGASVLSRDFILLS